MLRWIMVVLFGVCVGLPSAAADETTSVRAVGAASLSGADPRTRALDAAFRRAIRDVTVPLLPSRLSAQERAALERDVYRRARRFIASYRLEDQSEEAAKLRVRITARVAVSKLKEVLGSLGLTAERDAAEPAAATPTARPRPKLVVIARMLGPDGVRLIDRDASVKELGFEVARLRGAEELEDGAVTDDQALELARRSGAGGAVLISIKARRDGPIRGTVLVGASASATVRVLDAGQGQTCLGCGGRRVAGAEAARSGFGRDISAAESRASSEALALALTKVQGKLASYWPQRPRGQGGVVVLLSGARRHAAVRAVERHLAASRSKIAIVRRRLGAGTIRWTVESSLSPRRLAALLGSAKISSGAIRARAESADRIRVQISDYGAGGS